MNAPVRPDDTPDAATVEALSRAHCTALARRVAAPPESADAWRDVASAARALADVGRVPFAGWSQFAGSDAEAAAACVEALTRAASGLRGLSRERDLMRVAALEVAGAAARVLTKGAAT